jgi:FkbM family methyltransferase
VSRITFRWGGGENVFGLIQKLGRSVGVSIARYPPPNSLARHLRFLLKGMAVNCVLDVGAHKGQYVHLLRDDVGYRGRIVSFEPVSSTYAALKASCFRDPQWRGFRCALGRQAGTAEVTVFSGSDFNSILTPNRYAEQQFGRFLKKESSEEAPIRTLDDVFAEATGGLAGPRVHLKVDTQGYDLEVLEGGTSVLEHVVSLQMEAAFKPIYRGQPNIFEALTRLDALGYELAGIFTVSEQLDRLRIIEADILLVRAEALPP